MYTPGYQKFVYVSTGFPESNMTGLEIIYESTNYGIIIYYPDSNFLGDENSRSELSKKSGDLTEKCILKTGL